MKRKKLSIIFSLMILVIFLSVFSASGCKVVGKINKEEILPIEESEKDPETEVNEETPAGEVDRIESESIEFHKRVRNGYLAIVKNEPERCVLIDSDRPILEISKDITSCVSERFDI